MDVTGTTAGLKANSVTATSTEGGSGNTSNASLTVIAPATLAKSFGAASLALNGSTALTFVISNPHTTAGLTGIGFSDTLPPGMVVSTPNGLSGSCGGGTITAAAGNASITLSGASLGAQGTCTIAINITGIAAGVQNNTTTAVASVEGGPGNAGSAGITVVAPPALAKAFGAAAVQPNGSTTLAFTITNPNAASGLSGLSFIDTLPAGLTVSTPNGLGGGSCGGTVIAAAGGTSISLASGTLAASASCAFRVNVTVTTLGVKVNTTGAISSNEGGIGSAASATLQVSVAVTLNSSPPGRSFIADGVIYQNSQTVQW